MADTDTAMGFRIFLDSRELQVYTCSVVSSDDPVTVYSIRVLPYMYITLYYTFNFTLMLDSINFTLMNGGLRSFASEMADGWVGEPQPTDRPL